MRATDAGTLQSCMGLEDGGLNIARRHCGTGGQSSLILTGDK